MSALAAGVVAAAIVLTAPVSLPVLAVGALAVLGGVVVGLGVHDAITQYQETGQVCVMCLVKGAAITVGIGIGVMAAAAAFPAAAAVIGGVALAVGIGSLAYTLYNWDNMSHDDRMEATGGVLGGFVLVAGARAVRGLRGMLRGPGEPVEEPGSSGPEENTPKPGEEEPAPKPGEEGPNEPGKPRGPRAKPNPNDKDPENARALQRQNDSADTLAKNNYDVEQLSEANSGKAPGTKHPDFKVDGEPYDNYAPKTGNARNMASEVGKKVESGQTKNVVLNLDDSPATNEAVIKQFQDYPVEGLDNLLIVRNGEVIPVPLKGP